MSIEQEEKIIKLHELGVCDAEIARIVGKTREWIRQYRIAHNLPSNFKGNYKATFLEQEAEHLMELYRQGYSDKEMAELTECSRTHIYYWRTSNNLTPNIDRSRSERDKNIKQLYTQGLSDSEIARTMHIYPETVIRWRTANGVLSNKKLVKGRGN